VIYIDRGCRHGQEVVMPVVVVTRLGLRDPALPLEGMAGLRPGGGRVPCVMPGISRLDDAATAERPQFRRHTTLDEPMMRQTRDGALPPLACRPVLPRQPGNQRQPEESMTTVHFDISMSLDGFITGPGAGVGRPLGADDGRLHDWMFAAKTVADAEVVDELYARTGAILMGRRMFDVGVEPWGDPPPFHGLPVFVLTHEARQPLPMQGGTTYTFVTDGIEAGLEQAEAVAGEKDVGIWGGAKIIQQYLKASLLDEMQIHLIPVLLGNGVRLFQDLGPERIELKATRAIQTPAARHLRFTVAK
jgi:dihydrofolate reductase